MTRGCETAARYTVLGKQLNVGSEIGRGTEGIVYQTDMTGVLAKIYYEDRRDLKRAEKLKVMSTIRAPASRVAWPSKLIQDDAGRVAGFTMALVDGLSLEKSLFGIANVKRAFPNWNKTNIIDTAVSLVEGISKIHETSALVGDLSGNNLVVTGKSQIGFLDCDSFQISNLPSPVGTAKFQPPWIHQTGRFDALRTQKDELWSLAVLLFMILMHGQHPFSRVGGTSVEENIIQRQFVYDRSKFRKRNLIPAGEWRKIWLHLGDKSQRNLQALFCECFSDDHPPSTGDWLKALKAHRKAIQYRRNEDRAVPPLDFPRSSKSERDISCSNCGKLESASLTHIENTGENNYLCTGCTEIARVRRIQQSQNFRKDRQKFSDSQNSSSEHDTSNIRRLDKNKIQQKLDQANAARQDLVTERWQFNLKAFCGVVALTLVLFLLDQTWISLIGVLLAVLLVLRGFNSSLTRSQYQGLAGIMFDNGDGLCIHCGNKWCDGINGKPRVGLWIRNINKAAVTHCSKCKGELYR